MDLDIQEKKIVELWFLTCEDWAREKYGFPEGGCHKCPFQKKCEYARIKLFGTMEIGKKIR